MLEVLILCSIIAGIGVLAMALVLAVVLGLVWLVRR